jgi:hypothetical protein
MKDLETQMFSTILQHVGMDETSNNFARYWMGDGYVDKDRRR